MINSGKRKPPRFAEEGAEGTVLLTRCHTTPFDTIGKLSINGVFACYTLEDEPQQTKIPGETRIPAGTYNLALRFSPHFSPRYGHEMLWLQNVPGFEFILIHCGNTKADTAGCILVGSSVQTLPGKPSILSESRKAYESIYPVLASATKAGPVQITVIDQPKEGEICFPSVPESAEAS